MTQVSKSPKAKDEKKTPQPGPIRHPLQTEQAFIPLTSVTRKTPYQAFQANLMPRQPKLPLVAVLTPAYRGEVSIHYTLSIMEMAKRQPMSFQMRLILSHCGALIAKERNELVHQALEDPNVTHVLFADSDQGWSPETIERLLAAGKDIIGAVVPRKEFRFTEELFAMPASEAITRAMSYNVRPLEGGFDIDEAGVCEVQHIGTGLTLVKRGVFEKMRAAQGGTLYWSDRAGTRLPAFFAHEVDGILLGEDIAFNRQWQAMGGKIHALIDAKVRHIGPSTWHGDGMTWAKSGAAGPISICGSMKEAVNG